MHAKKNICVEKGLYYEEHKKNIKELWIFWITILDSVIASLN